MITILDGGMGRELQRSGAPFRQPEWSALALMESPDHVRKAHEAFAAAGAHVITTNSYAVVPFHIGTERFAADGAHLAGLAGTIARDVGDRMGVTVAGSLPPVMGSYRPDLFVAEQARPILQVLIDALAPSVDLWLAETQSSLAEAELIGAMLSGDDRPLWISFTLDDTDAEGVEDGRITPTLRSGEAVADAALLAQSLGAASLLFNCSQPEVMEAAIRIARSAIGDSAMAIGVYANAFSSEADDSEANETLHDIRADLDPPTYCLWSKKWIEAGATMVGGCCGIAPEHIKRLRHDLA